MYDVLTVSRFIINYSNEKEYGISNLRLQKLLYFVQAVFLCEKGEECFKENVLAWDFGPVVQEAYQEFKMFGSSNIPVVNYYDVNSNNVFLEPLIKKFDDSIIDKEDKIVIQQVIDDLEKYSTTRLVSITHNQKPWRDAYIPGKNCIIESKAIKDYFANE